MMKFDIVKMYEDAQRLGRPDFVDIYGTANIAFWDEVNGFGWDE